MTKYTDSTIVEYNEDGSQTITTIEHYTPPTRAQKATAAAALGGVLLVPFVPVAIAFAQLKAEEYRAKRRNHLKVVKSD